jgi:hypothetical protein
MYILTFSFRRQTLFLIFFFVLLLHLLQNRIEVQAAVLDADDDAVTVSLAVLELYFVSLLVVVFDEGKAKQQSEIQTQKK